MSPLAIPLHGLRKALRWKLTSRPEAWPSWIPSEPGAIPPERIGEGLRITWVGHATVLIQAGNTNLLVDPIWSGTAGPLPAVGCFRRKAPGLRMEDLPPLDAVLVTHNHYDHLDLRTLRRLIRRQHCPVFVPEGLAAFLCERGVPDGRDLRWWESADIGSLRVHLVPARHYSRRTLWDLNRVLWGGFAVETPAGLVLHPGDTGLGPHFQAIRDRLGPVRCALLPIGAHLPAWFMAPVHMGPEDAVAAAALLEAEVAIPIHHGTFPLADDGPERPLQDLAVALSAQPGERGRWRVVPEGQGLCLP